MNGLFLPAGESGVAVTPPALISGQLKAQVAALLADVPADKHGAIVGVATEAGVNLAFAYRVDNRLQVAAWVGKSGWAAPVSGGVTLKATF